MFAMCNHVYITFSGVFFLALIVNNKTYHVIVMFHKHFISLPNTLMHGKVLVIFNDHAHTHTKGCNGNDEIITTHQHPLGILGHLQNGVMETNTSNVSEVIAHPIIL